MDLHKLPKDTIERISYFVEDSIQELLKVSRSFIKDEYENRIMLEECINFSVYNLEDVFRSDFETLRRTWLFPPLECSGELQEALCRILECSYKSSFDHCRRALEIAVVGCYFVQEEVSQDSGMKWLRSDENTPFFSHTCMKLFNKGLFLKFDRAFYWVSKLKKMYGRLGDFVHTRGMKYSLNSIQPSHALIGGFRMREFCRESVIYCLDTYVETVRHLATLYTLNNPVLLVGLPLDEKFGGNGPFSGFFAEGQSQLLRNILFEETREFFENEAENNEGVQSVLDWIKELPDMPPGIY